MNRDRIPTHYVRRTKDPTPDPLFAQLLPVLIARPDPPRSYGNGASSDVRLRHVCGRKRAGDSSLEKKARLVQSTPWHYGRKSFGSPAFS